LTSTVLIFIYFSQSFRTERYFISINNLYNELDRARTSPEDES